MTVKLYGEVVKESNDCNDCDTIMIATKTCVCFNGKRHHRLCMLITLLISRKYDLRLFQVSDSNLHNKEHTF